MEREVVITGIGGQGVQLAGQVLARAAVIEQRRVLLFANYGGMMRGGNTEATVVVGDEPITAPPVVADTWAAVVLHHEYWADVAPKVRPGGLVLVNTSVFAGAIGVEEQVTVLDVPATDLAIDLGGIVVAGMVMLGALARATGIVDIDSLESGLDEALPPYRRDVLELNVRALRAGVALDPGRLPAWPEGVRA